MINRTNFIAAMAAASGTVTFAGGRQPKPQFNISLAQWSVRKLHRGEEPGAEKLSPLDFAVYAKNSCGISALEYVNSFYFGKEGNEAYFNELKKRADDQGVKSLLIMCDRCGRVGDPKEAARITTVEKHKPWMEAAAQLGCHSIRVNAGSSGSFEEQQKLVADGLIRLAEVAKPYGLNVIVENHGGLSSNGAWLAGVMNRVNLPTVGTLPDFGNFMINRKTGEEYDRYKGMEELMPFAKGVSAKSHAFDAEGNETTKDYYRIMNIVADSGYSGYIGVEWEGAAPGTTEGILLTKALIEKAIAAL
ncbi:sugar phosphate isomerase/epimerase family protein [Pontiella agarivorans]|uniref:Sugar phosphate isomerase/epimerase n=1 Tax=Pontiella agarivorans TaxID=3038953 RepID=A0ABU5MW14_9BACT|nr:sugar phosphate isomerase/epimerase family protein [Pontiella agarivorans]MDZ8118307.1 sugar phosphate isomerase/epimerase [Pontiella agarivorans]